ncbi:MAG: hypothetical protein KF819_03435 [Labilithrix sp.]|nr:hypothetical protein [Labilithrix sp.]
MGKRGLSDNMRVASIGAAGTVMAFFVFGGLSSGLFRGAMRGPGEPVDAVPKGSFIAVTVDMAELRQSPLHELIAPRSGAQPASGSGPLQSALGIGPLAAACGFDPLARVQRLAIAVPEEGERGEFGLVARVEVTRAELEKCTSALAEKRGAKSEAREVGSFAVVDSGGSQAKLGYGSGGLLVVGKGAWFDAMLGAADKTKPGLRDAPEHVAMRASLTSKEGFRSPTLVASIILPRALRERLKGEMGAELGGHDAENAMWAGVLDVSSLGVAIRAGGPGQNVDAAVEIVCESAEACDAVDKLVQRKRLEWSKELSLRLVGLGPLIDSLETKRHETRLRATASVDAAGFTSTIERILKLRSRPKDAPPPSPPPASRDRSPHETIPAKP